MMSQKKNDTYHTTCGLENIDRKQWTDFVANHPHGTIFQTPEYYEIHQDVKGFRPFVIALLDSAGSMVGVMLVIIHQVYGGLLGTMTSRAVIAGGPLVQEDDPELASLILRDYVENKQTRVVYSQFRNLFESGKMKSAFADAGAVYEDHLNILIDLTQTEEELWKGVKSRKRNNIRQAQRKGLTVRRLTTKSEADEAYSILMEVYKRAKLPLADKQLFINAFMDQRNQRSDREGVAWETKEDVKGDTKYSQNNSPNSSHLYIFSHSRTYLLRTYNMFFHKLISCDIASQHRFQTGVELCFDFIIHRSRAVSNFVVCRNPNLFFAGTDGNDIYVSTKCTLQRRTEIFRINRLIEHNLIVTTTTKVDTLTQPTRCQ